MPRLGEHLVAAGLLTAEQVEQALRAQVMWGGRLGTNLVELHYLELDPLSRTLGRQRGMPAALSRHFQRADRELQRRLSPEIAERLSCVPLLRLGPEQRVVVATLGPLSPRQLAILADELVVDIGHIVPAIAAELRIRYQLERVYQVRRAARFLRARGKSIPPFPAFGALPDADADTGSHALPITTEEIELLRSRPGEAGAFDLPIPPPPPAVPVGVRDLDRIATEPGGPFFELIGRAATDDDLIPVEVVPPGAAMLDDEPAGGEPIEDEASARERRTYVRTITDEPHSDAERHALLGRIAIRKVAVGSAPRIMAGATLGEATRAIRRSTGRDRVAELVIDTLDRFAPACEAAIMLVVRGGTAIGWKGFQRGGVLGEIAVSLEDGGLVPRAIEHNVSIRQPCGELEAIDQVLLASLGQPDGDLVVVPIAIASQVMCVIAMATGPGTPVPSAEPIAAAASAAFARLIRDASR